MRYQSSEILHYKKFQKNCQTKCLQNWEVLIIRTVTSGVVMVYPEELEKTGDSGLSVMTSVIVSGSESIIPSFAVTVKTHDVAATVS